MVVVGAVPQEQALKIEFSRYGGFTGVQLNVELDSQSLSLEEIAHIRDLVEKADFFNLPSSLKGSVFGRDQFQYKITVQEENRRHSVWVEEGAASEGLRLLLGYLTQRAKTRKK